jgi:hypothetical protein
VRKILITALVGATMGVTGLLAMPGAKAVSTCTTGVTPSGTGGTATVGTPIGCATASGDAAAQSGYVVADGAASNPGASSGYIGFDGSDGGPTVVGCGNGDYAPGAGTQYDADTTQGNHVIGSQAHPPSAPDPADPCTPTAP